jgi:hypothetical protein
MGMNNVGDRPQYTGDLNGALNAMWKATVCRWALWGKPPPYTVDHGGIAPAKGMDAIPGPVKSTADGVERVVNNEQRLLARRMTARTCLPRGAC